LDVGIIGRLFECVEFRHFNHHYSPGFEVGWGAGLGVVRLAVRRRASHQGVHREGVESRGNTALCPSHLGKLRVLDRIIGDWELWLSLPDGILADLRGSPELHAVMKQQREFEEQQRIARFAQNNGDASSQAGGVRVTVVDEDPTTASASGRPATPPGGKPGIWNDGVWIANGTAPLDEIQFPAAWAVKKHQQLIATVVSPRDQTVPPGIPTPNPVITASCKEIAFSKI
jgi:hypothetical protein